MKRNLVLVIVFSLLCPSGVLLAQERKGAEIAAIKTDGTEIEGELIAVKRHSLLLLESSSGMDASINIEDINAVKIVKNSGLYWGALLGGIAGGCLGRGIANPQNLWEIHKGIETGAVFAVIGVLSGAAIGHLIDISMKFQIEGKSQEEVESVLEKLRSKARFPNIDNIRETSR